MGLGKWKNWRNFFTRVGPGFFFKKLFTRLFYQWSGSKSKVCQKVWRSIEDSCNRDVLKYLKKKYLPVIEQYDYQESSEQIGPTSNIWVLWWQGYEDAPDIAKACISSIKKNAGSHPVVLLDQHNYKQYITLPDYVVEKFEKGRMSITHFSNMIRLSLLYGYGGIWIDSTIYMLHPLDEIVENSMFYSLHTADDEVEPILLGNGHWSTFFLACCKGNHIIGLINKLLFEYWKREDTLFAYHTFDYFIAMIYLNVEAAKKTIDEIPISNSNLGGLSLIMNENRDKLKQLQNDGTYLYKLTYKMDLFDSINGEETIYHMLVHEGWDGSIKTDSV